MSTPNTPIWASKYHSPLKAARYPGGMAAPEAEAGAGAGAVRDDVRQQDVTESVWDTQEPREGSRGGRIEYQFDIIEYQLDII